jgi:hypothetical protein
VLLTQSETAELLRLSERTLERWRVVGGGPVFCKLGIEALPHEHPRLGAIATASMNGQDFASLLERTIARSHKGPEVKQIEAHALTLTSEKSR